MALIASRMCRHTTIWLLAAVISVASALPAWSDQSLVGTYGAPFLRIPVGARLTASLDAVAGMRPDASLAFSNPAFTSSLSETQLFFSTANWLDDLRFSAASAVVPVGQGTTVLSLGTSFLYSGGLQGFDQALSVVSEESYYDLNLQAGVSHRFDDLGLAVGASGSYVRQHLYPEDGNGVAFTAGATYSFGPNAVHAVARNFGGSVKFDAASYNIDPEAIVGAARRIDIAYGEIIVGAQVVYSRVLDARLEFGADYRVNEYFTLRTGYRESPTREGAPVNAGFGVQYNVIGIEYAFTPQEFFGNTHTVSVVLTPRLPSRGVSPQEAEVGNAAPVVSASQIQSAPVDPVATPPVLVIPPQEVPETVEPPAKQRFVIVAGTHRRLESARAEVRALELLHIASHVEPFGVLYRVILGRYGNHKDAMKALADFKSKGHVFDVVPE